MNNNNNNQLPLDVAKTELKKAEKKVDAAPKKKAVKKPAKKKAPAKKRVAKKTEAPKQEITIVNNNVLDPIVHQSKYSLSKTWVEEKQILKMMQRTPAEHVRQRPGKGGGTWDYVTGVYVKKVLNYVFGFNWDFEIVKEDVYGLENPKGGQIVVKGKLTVKSPKGDQTVSKMQYGSADVKYKKDGKVLDIGNDFKAAATDALKKCAAEFGIASDVYGKNEFKDIGVQVQTPVDNKQVKTVPVPQAPEVDETIQVPEFECHECGNPMTKQEAEYRQKLKQKQLCKGCVQAGR